MDEIIQQSPIPQQTPIQPEIPSRNSSSNWLRTLAIGFGIVSIGTAIAVGGYFLGTKNSQPPVQKIVAQSSPTPADQTSSWKTYMNSNAGYSFKYPNDYQIMENQKKSVDGVTVNTPNTTTILSSVLSSLNTNMQIDILYENKAGDLSGAEVAKKFGLSINATPYTIDGKSGFIFADTPLGAYGSTIIYILANDKSYTFTIESHASYSQYKQYLDQILSSFKFIN